jgi:ribulose-phosphate 3-epimerase
MAVIAPALVAADFARLGEGLAAVKAAGAPMVHLDICDGHFACEVTLGQPVVESLRKATDLVLDVHLAIERPERYISDFSEAGADRLAIHAEATAHPYRTLDIIRAKGKKAGLALNPGTPLASAWECFDRLDFLLLLAPDGIDRDDRCWPQFIDKTRDTARLRQDKGLGFQIEVEGGIGPESIAELVSAGADILVAGNTIFHTSDLVSRIREFVRLADINL